MTLVVGPWSRAQTYPDHMRIRVTEAGHSHRRKAVLVPLPPTGSPHRTRPLARSDPHLLTARHGQRLPDRLDGVRNDDHPGLRTLAAGIDRDRGAGFVLLRKRVLLATGSLPEETSNLGRANRVDKPQARQARACWCAAASSARSGAPNVLRRAWKAATLSSPKRLMYVA